MEYHECNEQESLNEKSDPALIWLKDGEWILKIEDYGDTVVIKHCPFCGIKLPTK